MSSTRRSFLMQTLLGGAALTSGVRCTAARSPSTGRPESVHPTSLARVDGGTSERKLGVALLGLGSYSEGQLAPALQKTRHCALRGIVTGSPQKVATWQARHAIEDRHVYDYRSFSRIANDDAIDVVYVVVPTGLHAKYAIMAAEAGKHVWCEKPMAMTVAECEQIIAACRANRVKLSIGYRMQHEPNTQTVRSYGRSKPYGAVTKVRALAGHAGGGGASWRMQKSLGGGALYDMGVYAINAIRYGSGEEPVRVLRAQHSTKRPKLFREVDETTEFELELASGASAYGKTSVGENINELRVDCERGWYELEPLQPYQGVKGRTSDGKLLDQPIDNQQARQMDDDARAILDGTDVLVPGEEGLRDIRIVQAIMAAAASGAPIQI
jgi:glucose-fructose oxidoreductase